MPNGRGAVAFCGVGARKLCGDAIAERVGVGSAMPPAYRCDVVARRMSRACQTFERFPMKARIANAPVVYPSLECLGVRDVHAIEKVPFVESNGGFVLPRSEQLREALHVARDHRGIQTQFALPEYKIVGTQVAAQRVQRLRQRRAPLGFIAHGPEQRKQGVATRPPLRIGRENDEHRESAGLAGRGANRTISRNRERAEAAKVQHCSRIIRV